MKLKSQMSQYSNCLFYIIISFYVCLKHYGAEANIFFSCLCNTVSFPEPQISSLISNNILTAMIEDTSYKS